MEGSIRETKGDNAGKTGELKEKQKIRSQGQANKSIKMSRNKKERDAGKQWKKNKHMPTHRLRPVHALVVREWQSRLSGPSCLYRFLFKGEEASGGGCKQCFVASMRYIVFVGLLSKN